MILTKITRLLSDLPSFSHFSKKELIDFGKGGERTNLAKGHVLFYQGDESDSVYVLLTGRLSAVLDFNQEHMKFLGLVKPGDLVGEMGVIISGPRSCTIIAQKNSSLLKLKSDTFLKKAHANTALLIMMNKLLTVRLKNTVKRITIEEIPHVISIVPANSKTDITEFMKQFEKTLKHSDLNYLIVDDAFCRNLLGENYNEKNILILLDKLEEQNLIVFYKGTYNDLTWFTIILEQCDRLLVLMDADEQSEIAPKLKQFLLEKTIKITIKEVVLMHHANKPIRDTEKLVKDISYDRLHHIYLNSLENYQRLLRFTLGMAIGVVLGGGGTRGWTHVGCLIALEENGVPIDAMVGTSAGSLVAACYLTSQTREEFLEKVGILFCKGKQMIEFVDYTWPKISLLSGKKINQFLFKVFGEKKIEDLSIPLRIMASNLSTSSAMIIQTGMIWEAIRTSSSVPGILPPVVKDGELLVDGAVINNFPTNVMHYYLERKGLIIGIDLSLTNPIKPNYNFPSSLTIIDYLKNWLGLSKVKYNFTSTGNILMDSISIGSAQFMDQNKRHTEILIQPELFGTSMLNNPDHEKLIQWGYAETNKQIKLWEDAKGIKLKDYCVKLKING